MIRRLVAVSTCLAGLAFAPGARAKITLDFDFSLDAQSHNFFNPNTPAGQAARAALAKAGEVYQDRFVDTLSNISPGGGNTWTTNFTNPGTGQAGWAIANLNIPANTIKIFVGGRPLDGAIGFGGPGGYSATAAAGNTTFLPSVQYRGQAGASVEPPSTDFGPGGGGITFDKSVAWNFNLGGPVANQNDFLTVAVHEIAHVLGIGTAPSWKSLLTVVATPFGKVQYVGPFTGPKASALNGGPAPLEEVPPQMTMNEPIINAAHFNYGTMSTVGGLVAQESILDPDITLGTRKRLTLLDWAALDDIGWEVARAGDANADGTVDFNDLVAVAQNYNVSDGQRRWAHGDFNYDGRVDFNDLVELAQNYNTTGAQGVEAAPVGASAAFSADWAAAQTAGVPEPGIGVVMFGVASVLLRRRQGR